ncbi:MAG TPA: response regulator [Lacipirellulaceae bacterium]|jgi:two-component system chemotaxis response regulator CheY
MPKRVLDVGQCGPDHAAIRRFFAANFNDVEIEQAAACDDTLALLRRGHFDLVLVNRKLDEDYSDGIEIIRAIKRHPEFAAVPVMLITNYPEHQATAVTAGALHGFGKLEYDLPATKEKIATALGI